MDNHIIGIRIIKELPGADTNLKKHFKIVENAHEKRVRAGLGSVIILIEDKERDGHGC
jgi:hypothetical protein